MASAIIKIILVIGIFIMAAINITLVHDNMVLQKINNAYKDYLKELYMQSIRDQDEDV